MYKMIFAFSLLVLNPLQWAWGDACPASIKNQQAKYKQNIILPEHAEGYFNFSGGSIFYRYFSSNSGPLVILAPGLPASIYFSDLIDRLIKEGYNVLSFDYPGKMNSRLASKNKSSVKFVVQQTQKLFQFLNLYNENPWYILGTSLGGVIAAQLAQDNAAYVKGLILMNPVGLEHTFKFNERLAKYESFHKVFALTGLVKSGVKNNISNALACASENYENLLSEQDQYLESRRNRRNYLNIIGNLGIVNNTQVYKSLQKASFPILITHGEAQYDTWLDQVQQLKPLLTQAQYLEIPGVSHIPFIENPEKTMEILKDFMN